MHSWSLVLVPLLQGSEPTPVLVPVILVSLVLAAWLFWSFPWGCVCQPHCPAHPSSLSHVPLLYVTPVFPFLFWAALCPARVLVFLSQCAVLRDALSLNDLKLCQQNSFLRGKWLKWACRRRAGRRRQEDREESIAARTREAAAQTPPSTTFLLGDVPLGICSLRVPSWWWCCCERCGCLELLLPGFSAVPCAFKVNVLTVRSFRRYDFKLPVSLWARVFCGSCICSLPKASFWADGLYGNEKEKKLHS